MYGSTVKICMYMYINLAMLSVSVLYIQLLSHPERVVNVSFSFQSLLWEEVSALFDV